MVDVSRSAPLTATVRSAPLPLLLVVLLSACATPEGARPVGPAVRGQSTRITNDGSATTNRGNPQKSGPSVRLDEMVLGRVASVNPPLRFVVMDFPIRRMPAREQRLNVYRNGQKIGEVKVTGPALDTTTAGDIVAGEAQIGDEVRED